MEKLETDEILTKIDELIILIKDCTYYKKYISIKEKMKDNKDISDLIINIKDVQKKIVKLEYEKKDISSLEKEVESCLSKLREYPIYMEYTYALEDLNLVMEEVKYILENCINKQVSSN